MLNFLKRMQKNEKASEIQYQKRHTKKDEFHHCCKIKRTFNDGVELNLKLN